MIAPGAGAEAHFRVPAPTGIVGRGGVERLGPGLAASEPRGPQPDPVDPVRPPEPPPIDDPVEEPPPAPNPDERNPPVTMTGGRSVH